MKKPSPIKQPSSKLTLSTERVKTLTADQLDRVGGGESSGTSLSLMSRACPA